MKFKLKKKHNNNKEKIYFVNDICLFYFLFLRVSLYMNPISTTLRINFNGQTSKIMLFRQIENATALVDFPSYNTGKKLDAEIKNLSSVVDNFMQKISVVTFRRT